MGRGIVRDGEGKFILDYASNFGTKASNMAEALSLLWDIKFIALMGNFRIQVEGDSKLIIDIVNR